MKRRIPFSDEMIIAILSGNKTQIRRCSDKYKHIKPGDIMYGTEAFTHIGDLVTYRAGSGFAGTKHWTPAMLMPYEKSRIQRTIISVRQEHLHDMTNEDIAAEGLPFAVPTFDEYDENTFTPIEWWMQLWDSINGEKEGCAWADNPMVTVIEWEKA